jgi:hypothetical protein
MVVVPAAIPVTTPVTETVPTAGVLLLHVPDGLISVNVVVLPAHTAEAPLMAAGEPLTVTTIVAGVVQEVI